MSDKPELLAGQPQDKEGLVFREPWEAQAFAMVMVLHERTVFEWPEWTGVLAVEIAKAQASGDPDLGDTYYAHWLSALERVVVTKGISSDDDLARYAHAWENAAHRTLHGRPIELQPEDFEPGR